MATKTYAQLDVETTVEDTDLLATYRGSGPLKRITWDILKTDVLLAFERKPVLVKTANYTATTDDVTQLIEGSGTWTLSFQPVATLGEGWWIPFRNTGTGIITLNPDGTELINGQTTIQLSGGQSCFIYADSTGLVTVGTGGFAATTVAVTAAAYIDIPLPAEFTTWKITGAIKPSASGAQLLARASIDNGATVISGASDYKYGATVSQSNALATSYFSNGDSKMILSANSANTSSTLLDFTILSLSGQTPFVSYEATRNFASGVTSKDDGGASIATTTTLTTLRIYPDSGTITGYASLQGMS